TAHGTDLIGYQESERFRKDATLAAKKAKKIITISEKNKKLVEECFPFAKDKVVLIPNGYDAGEILFREL
ncbi:glycosyltransferase family 4 protein, partial [Candidatus Saccharibacteria bacterium]|nr:glycosyltransferase family 4 protein [Candidatus Saccharibacteria bacterium]